jgi:hypothetical protein
MKESAPRKGKFKLEVEIVLRMSNVYSDEQTKTALGEAPLRF